MKKAVSPLIAGILLIALTVSIGAMIIGWGKEYVKKHVSCMNYELEILNAKADYTGKTLSIGIENTGMAKIILSSEASPLVFQAVIGGQTYYCPVKKDVTSLSPDECAIQEQKTDLNPGDIATVKIYFGSGIDLTKYQEGEFLIKGCGTIGTKITQYMLS